MSETNRLLSGEQEAGEALPPALGAVPMTRLQRTVARRMVAAKTTVPEFTSEVEIDMGAIRDLRQSSAGAPSYNDFVIAACARALREVPKLNASFSPDPDEIVYHEQVNIGVAVASEGALVVPTVFDADRKSLAEISATVKELAAKARAGSLSLEEMSEQTFTVSNLGMHGVSRFTAIISPPQVGILAVGAVREALVPAGGAPEVRPQMAAVLSADHRVVYGADAAAFLSAFRAGLEQPDQFNRTNDFSMEQE